MIGEVFDTGAIRQRVLAGWVAAPVRFREDANAEEDHALGGYRDRVLIELAQNAADAARRAGVPGRLLFALRELDGAGVLVAANTGAALDAAGVQALATLRASAKRPDADAGPIGRAGAPEVPEPVGRFGVGFSAVLAVSDEPAVLSRHGGVRFSRADTRDLVLHAGSADLTAELARRDGHVPALRLPFPADGEPPEGYDTAVILPLRDGAADDLVRHLLAEVDDTLLLALPGLREVQIEVDGATRAASDVESRWFLLRRNGSADATQFADRPTEERGRTGWSVTWALPRSSRTAVPGVLHAPTPTDEPLTWRALLIASFPLEASRRHVAPGPATDTVLSAAASAYADLVAEVLTGERGENDWRTEDLVPVGFPAGALDGALREAAVAALRRTPILRSAEDGAPIRPRDAVALAPPAGADAAVVTALAPSVAGLVLAPRRAQSALDSLGIQRITLSELIEQLPVGRSPAAWRGLYDAFTDLAVDPLTREALAAIPVPLADGRVVRGVRGAVLIDHDGTGGDEVGAALALLGVRAVHPAAAHPLLERLGAPSISLRTVLVLPELQAAVEASLEDREDGQTERIDAVLTLVSAAIGAGEPPSEDLPWRGRLALIDAEGEIAPAGELVLPGSPAAALLEEETVAPVAAALLDRWGVAVLGAVGVLGDLALVRAGDLPLDGAEPPDSLADLPDVADWVDAVLALVGEDVLEVTAHDVVAVRDLDAVRPSAWPEVLALLAGRPELREAVVRPVRVTATTDAGQRSVEAPSWTAWWLGQELFDGRRWADADADGTLDALLGTEPPLVAGLDPALRRALGGVTSIADLDLGALGGLLEALADPKLELDLDALLRIWRDLACVADSVGVAGADVAAPPRVRAVRDGMVVVVDTEDAVVVDHPAWLQRGDLGAAVVVASALAPDLADLLDLPLAGDDGAGRVAAQDCRVTEVPGVVRRLLPGAPRVWCEHEELRVDGVEVSWWVDGHGPDARVHAATLEGLARGLAWVAGAWHLRYSVSAALDGTVPVHEILLDDAL